MNDIQTINGQVESFQEKKYWWLLMRQGSRSWDTVVDVHPFVYSKIYRDVQLDKWQQISVDEYNMWKELNEK